MRVQQVEMGAIYCKHCMAMIDTQPTEKVTNYYSECEDAACLDRRLSSNSSVRVEQREA